MKIRNDTSIQLYFLPTELDITFIVVIVSFFEEKNIAYLYQLNSFNLMKRGLLLLDLILGKFCESSP